MKTVCCTGHRPSKMPWGYNKDCAEYDEYIEALTAEVLSLIEDGFTHFISGMALGTDMDFADIVLQYRDKVDCPITLECAIPCENQTLKWKDSDKERYNNLIAKADKVTMVGTKYTPSCMCRRNEYMVDNSDVIIAVWNGKEEGGTWYSIQYARRRKKRIEIITV